MARRDNWPAILEAFLNERRTRPFSWVDQNCALFAADWVKELTGIDPAAEFRSRILGPLSAMRIVRQAGGITVLVDDACSAHGWPSVPLFFARRGDLVLTETDHGPAVGISLGHSAAFAGSSGLTFQSKALLWRAWQIS